MSRLVVPQQVPEAYALHQWPCAHVPFVGQIAKFVDTETGEFGWLRVGEMTADHRLPCTALVRVLRVSLSEAAKRRKELGL